MSKVVGYTNDCSVWCLLCVPRIRAGNRDSYPPVSGLVPIHAGVEAAGESCLECGQDLQDNESEQVEA